MVVISLLTVYGGMAGWRILCSTTDGRTALGVEYYNIIHGYNTQWGSLELYK